MNQVQGGMDVGYAKETGDISHQGENNWCTCVYVSGCMPVFSVCMSSMLLSFKYMPVCPECANPH